MALNFPDPATQTPVNTWSPTSTPSASTNGLTYLWDGTKWGTTGGPDVHVLKAGDTMTGNLTVPSLNDGPLAGFRNQIINGCLRNWQRGLAGNGTDYGADRMFFANPGTGGNNERDTNAPPESGLQYSYAINENAILVNSVEILGNGSPFINGSEWTFSFYARLDIRESSDNEIQFATGNAAASNPVSLASGFTWSKETLASGWRRYSYTFTVGSNPAAGNNCLRLWFRNVATRNTVTGFQLEPGPVATPFEHRPISAEKALCQRYYQKFEVASVLFGGSVADGTAVGGSQSYMPFNTAMRAIPTVLGNVTYTKEKGPGTITGVAFWQADPHGCRFNIGANAAGIYVVRVTEQPWFDAEL